MPESSNLDRIHNTICIQYKTDNMTMSVCTKSFTIPVLSNLKRGCQLLGLFFSFQITFLWLQHTCWRFVYTLVVTLSSLEQFSLFQRINLQKHIQMVNKTSSLKKKCIGNNAEVSRVNHSTLWCLHFPRYSHTSCYKLLLCQLWTEKRTPSLKKKLRNISM